MTPTDVPSLSVVVVVGSLRERAAQALRALLAQTALERMEIVLVDLRPASAPVHGAGHPSVRRVELGADATMAEGMAAGVLESRAPRVALVEDHCFPSPGWADAVLRAFDETGAEIVNYAFTDVGDTYLTRSFLVAEYGRWMAPATEGPVRIPALNNIAYAKDALLPYVDDLAAWFLDGALLHRRILDAGGVAWLAADALAAHEDWVRLLPGLRANAAIKRLYGAGLAKREGWGLPRRATYAAAMAVAPALHMARLWWSLRRRPSLWPTALVAVPVCLAVYVDSSVHEALGYLFGPGRAHERFDEVELETLRQP